ncbi:MAG: aldose 1-epimerase [Phycisphaerales bacterium]|nr:aldose 1-epimerase [Phycisphaerales bacterium]
MIREHQVERVRMDGFDAIRLDSPDGVAATFVPGAGMVCCSLTHRGEELLGQRRGLRVYAERGSTMGVPILHPWANRLGRMGYAIDGVEVSFPAEDPLLHRDGNGLPIHGIVAGAPDWQVNRAETTVGAAVLEATLDLGANPAAMRLFPFPHRLVVEAVLARNMLAWRTTVRATAAVPVPIAFGYHPYLRLPGVPREEWRVTLPVRRRMILDERRLPTGETEAAERLVDAPLGERMFDDLFVELDPDAAFVVEGGTRKLTVRFDAGYRCAVVYAPREDDVVCFEPMTAPTNPFDGGGVRFHAHPGADFSATFSVEISNVG